MVELPYDVWLEITALLDTDTLWNLRYMNSALREISLDVLYNTVSFSLKSLESTQQHSSFLKFREVYLSHRVRKLVYYSGVDTSFPKSPMAPTKNISMVQRYFMNFFKIRPIPKLDRALVKTAKMFVNISSLEFRNLGNEEKQVRKSILILNTTLQACYNALRILVLQLPIAYIPELVLPSIFIPNLTSICIAPNYSSRGTQQSVCRKSIASAVVPFVNKHRSTLTSLHLRLNPDGPSLFDGLEHIAGLKDFSMVISSCSQHKYIAQFLQKHSQTLEMIEVVTAKPSFQSLNQVFECICVSFPQLQTLCSKSAGTIFPQDFAHSFRTTGQCITKSASFLVSLTILNAPMDNNVFFEFLPPHTYTKLQDLHISLEFISGQTLDLMENALPNVRLLEINASRIRSSQNDPNPLQEERLVFQEFSQCDYSRWKLEEFKVLVDVRNLTSPAVEKFLYPLIAQAMCSVKTFNGVPLAEFISSGPVPIIL